jgi:peptidyl-tRNA hydrolase, PTH1 family
MSYLIVGLGNPGQEYENTRHNTGRIALEAFRLAEKFPDWESNSKLKALVSSGKVGKDSVTLVEPETFMNKSGIALGSLVKVKKSKIFKKGTAEDLVVIHDDLDIPFGKFKISFNKSSGGHRGVESIIKAIKTEAFVRIRVGISPYSAKATKGKPIIILKKPQGEAAVDKMILGKFSPDQLSELKKLSKKIAEALKVFVTEGKDKAMSRQY